MGRNRGIDCPRAGKKRRASLRAGLDGLGHLEKQQRINNRDGGTKPPDQESQTSVGKRLPLTLGKASQHIVMKKNHSEFLH